MSVKLITAPASEPVSLAEAVAHCRVDGSDDNALLTALIVTARRHAEALTGRALITQTLEQALDAFPAAEIELERLPAQSIASIKYLDAAGAEQTVGSADYGLDTYGEARQWIIPAHGAAWPANLASANAVKVRYVAGYGAAADVPQEIRQWMLLQVGHWYANREAVGDKDLVPLPYVDALLDAYRVIRVV